jgi:16S rRNA G966 N2-methylase RsmD
LCWRRYIVKSCKKKWGNATFYGNDISKKVIKLLKKNYPEWILENCDFLNIIAKTKLKLFNNKFDVILLNPPFSCRGSKKNKIIFDEIEFNISTAMAFFVESIKYLNKDGVLYAILPQSVAYSQKDEKIRNYLYEKYNFIIINEINKQEFEKCSPNIIIAAVNDKTLSIKNNTFKQINTRINNLKILRGNISMHNIITTKKGSLALIHSTNIKNNKIEGVKYMVKKEYSKIIGPALLICRVGQPNQKKICIIPSKKEYALSDCVIGIMTNSANDCKKLKNIIINNWSYFLNLYKGTGAKYVTIERIKYFLNLNYDKAK